jgi:CHAT domain-containing protein/Tfp pilus assembly protein PilF
MKIVVLWFVALSTGAVAGEAEWKAHINAAEAAYERRDYREAAAQSQEAVKEAQSFGERDLRYAESLSWLSAAYRAQARYAEAETTYRRVFAIREAVLGPDHVDVGESANILAFLCMDAGNYAEAGDLLLRSLAIQEKALGGNDPKVADTLLNLALLYRRLGRYADAEPLYGRILAIQQQAFGPDNPTVATTLNNLASLTEWQGRYAEAEPIYLRSLAIRESALGPEHPDVAQSLNNLAGLCKKQGRYAEADAAYRRSLAIFEKVLGPEHPNVGTVLGNVAALYFDQGRYAEGEPYLRRSLAIAEKALGLEHPDLVMRVNNMAAILEAQGRYAEAEPLYRRSLALGEKKLGSAHPDVARTLDNLAALYAAQDRHAEAEPLYLRALAIRKKVGGAEHPDVARTLNNLATTYRGQQRYAESEPLYLRALAIREKVFGREHPDVATVIQNLATLHRVQGHYAEAEPLYLRAIAIREKVLGPEHPHVAHGLNSLALMYRQQKRTREGLEAVRRATAILARRFASAGRAEGRGALSEQRRVSWGLDLHAGLLADGAAAQPARTGEFASEALFVVQLARATDTAEQVSRMAARFAAGSDALAQVARQRQDLVGRSEMLDATLLKEMAKSPTQRRGATEQQLRDDRTGIERQLAELDSRLDKEFPQYRELANPKPLALEGAQKLLGEGEALVAFLVGDEQSFVVAVRRGAVSFEPLAITRKELDGEVKKLRAQLDLGAGDPSEIIGKPFDVESAHALYRKVFAPVESIIAGARSLVIVPDAALQSLPPGVLVKKLPARPVRRPADHARVDWLAKEYAITVLPSIGSLRALRAFAQGNAAAEPFCGFGNPLLGGGAADLRGRKVAALFSRGAVADASEVRNAFAPLPETADELRAIAITLKAPADALYLGRQATESNVKSLDLSRYRTVAFATHAVMAGEFKGLAEPALVLTPPEKGNEQDDGLLTASEIASLRLNAEWVILSACNTAAADGTPGAEGLSGLAKAFFYAGARSLLVSHWAVSSDAAQALTTRMFEETQKGASKAVALQRSMLALMRRTDKAYFGHPALWAPFVVVGEGNSAWAGRR